MEYEESSVLNFAGKVFVGSDALKGGYASNPMLKGVDRLLVENGIYEIDGLINKWVRGLVLFCWRYLEDAAVLVCHFCFFSLAITSISLSLFSSVFLLLSLSFFCFIFLLAIFFSSFAYSTFVYFQLFPLVPIFLLNSTLVLFSTNFLVWLDFYYYFCFTIAFIFTFSAVLPRTYDVHNALQLTRVIDTTDRSVVMNGYGGNFDNEVCIFVCVRERECVRERRESVCEREDKERVCVCVWKRECVKGREIKW